MNIHKYKSIIFTDLFNNFNKYYKFRDNIDLNRTKYILFSKDDMDKNKNNFINFNNDLVITNIKQHNNFIYFIEKVRNNISINLINFKNNILIHKIYQYIDI